MTFQHPLVVRILCSVSLISLINAIPIDNGVLGLPEVSCEENGVKLTFNTEKSFNGRIFVKGMSDRDQCVQRYETTPSSTVQFALDSGTCNMRRQRRLGPQRGVEQSMTVIISFHDTFITKIDKAYRCTCFFMEADKVVTADIDVSMLPTTDLVDTARMPVCTYSVRRGSISGEAVQYANVGDEVYHVWECDSDMFGMLVHSCFVDDGAGQGKFQLSDENGCAIDKYVLSDLTYNQDLNVAYVEAHVFKFADKVNTYFQCAVSLCMKEDGSCKGVTPPNCSNNGRGNLGVNRYPTSFPFPPVSSSLTTASQPTETTRNVNSYSRRLRQRARARARRDVDDNEIDMVWRFKFLSSSQDSSNETTTPSSTEVDVVTRPIHRVFVADLDLSADKITVLDIDDNLEIDRSMGDGETIADFKPRDSYNIYQMRRAGGDSTPYVDSAPIGQVCLSTLAFGTLAALFLVIVSATCIVGGMHIGRQRMEKST